MAYPQLTPPNPLETDDTAMKLLRAGAWKVGMAGSLFLLLVGMSLAAAPPVEKEAPLPEAFLKKAPEGVADLKAIQDRVKTVLKKTMPAVVDRKSTTSELQSLR